MSSYLGRHAELYDLFYADKPYVGEAEFVFRCLQRRCHANVPRVLELACGTGRHALELERLGCNVLAIDYSQDMIECAQRRGEAAGSSVEFRLGDMRTLDVPEALFDAVVCLFDSIGYVQTNEALSGTLRNIHQVLHDDGCFVFEFWHAAAMLPGYDPVRVRRWDTPNGELIRISETSLDYANQLAEVRYTVFEPLGGDQHRAFSETQVNRFFQLQEMRGFLEVAGFQVQDWFAGFQEDAPIDKNAWHLVAVARKQERS